MMALCSDFLLVLLVMSKSNETYGQYRLSTHGWMQSILNNGCTNSGCFSLNILQSKIKDAIHTEEIKQQEGFVMEQRHFTTSSSHPVNS
jgi:hypothetical protein